MAYDLRHTGAEVDALLEKVKEALAEGKGFSTNDYTNEEKAQVERVRNGSVVTENTDSEVTPDGNKPVSGKGIAKAIEEAIEVAKVQFPESINALDYGEMRDAKYVSIKDGYIKDSQNLSCFNTMQPTNGKKRLDTVVAMSVTTDSLGVVFFNENREVIASLQSREMEQSTPSGVTYVRVNIPIPEGAQYFNLSYLSEAKKTELNAPDFYCYLTSDNSSGDVDVSYMPFKSGYITASTGDIVNTTDWANICYKEPIDTFGKKYLYISGMVLVTPIDRGIAFYDENKQYVSGIKWSDKIGRAHV